MSEVKHPPSPADLASWCLMFATLLLVLWLHLLPALLAGLLVYELVHAIAPRLHRRLTGERARLAAVVVLASLIVGLLTAAIFGGVAFFRSGAGSLTVLLQKMAEIVEGARGVFPPSVVEALPADVGALRQALADWLREHAPELRLAGAEAARALAHILIGMVIGAIVSLRETAPGRSYQPLARALLERAGRLGDAFRSVVFAQLRISALNTIFTGVYLAVLLPAFGVQLPFTKTLVAVTFVAGLLPIIGNLISNTVIFIVSLSVSPSVAVASLVYLIVIHKLEYFFNAQIVGAQIRARAWELLLAMVAMEAAFGVPGLVAAPIYYAYLKRELVDRGLV